MHHVVIVRHGPPEVLEAHEAPDPVPGDGEVRIAVRGHSHMLRGIGCAECKRFGDPLTVSETRRKQVHGTLLQAGRRFCHDKCGSRTGHPEFIDEADRTFRGDGQR